MTTWMCITGERREKCSWVMDALAEGWGEPCRVIEGPPPDDGSPFVVWGQLWLVEQVVPKAIAAGRPFWHIDNGFWGSPKGEKQGNRRITYRGIAPVLMDEPDMHRDRAPRDAMLPWRKDGEHIVLALPGLSFGRCIGFDMRAWCEGMRERLARATRRPVIVRHKPGALAKRKGQGLRPLDRDLDNAWAIVTHSSNVAVDAVMRGVPVFVAPTCAAAPVGRTDLDIENPVMPDRERWFSSLASQQFSLAEMADGTAYKLLRRVREQVDQSWQP